MFWKFRHKRQIEKNQSNMSEIFETRYTELINNNINNKLSDSVKNEILNYVKQIVDKEMFEFDKSSIEDFATNLGRYTIVKSHDVESEQELKEVVYTTLQSMVQNILHGEGIFGSFKMKTRRDVLIGLLNAYVTLRKMVHVTDRGNSEIKFDPDRADRFIDWFIRLGQKSDKSSELLKYLNNHRFSEAELLFLYMYVGENYLDVTGARNNQRYNPISLDDTRILNYIKAINLIPLGLLIVRLVALESKDNELLKKLDLNNWPTELHNFLLNNPDLDDKKIEEVLNMIRKVRQELKIETLDPQIKTFKSNLLF
ncbi:MAG: hypothetical protein QXM92_00995 [Candidatus Anstonellales archaeon]